MLVDRLFLSSQCNDKRENLEANANKTRLEVLFCVIYGTTCMSRFLFLHTRYGAFVLEVVEKTRTQKETSKTRVARENV